MPGLGATLKPSSKVTWVANFMTGQETKDAADNRNLFDTTLTLALSPKFSLMSNFDYGKEGDVNFGRETSWRRANNRSV